MNPLVVLLLSLLGLGLCAPNHLKTVVVETNKDVGAGAAVGGLGASASWGGFSASAGLGGLAGAGADAGVGAGARADAGVLGGASAGTSGVATGGVAAGGAVGVSKTVVVGGAGVGGGHKTVVAADTGAGAGFNAGAGVSAGAGVGSQQEGTVIVTKSVHHPRHAVAGGEVAASAVVVGQKGPANFDSAFNAVALSTELKKYSEIKLAVRHPRITLEAFLCILKPSDLSIENTAV
ncbi:hypothetical protein AAG570_003019 [Ranatra chinensis]|uniref:Uncharacterized protein n=1 Tax=Ranatra chinensis TaxID=642074 RepID=A0ABD0YJU9_9HEMI